MTELADRIMELKGADPDDCEDKDEAFVAELMADETYVEGKRDKLPKRFAGGRTVYLAHIWVYRSSLPGEKITRRRLPCIIVWDDPKARIITRPLSAKERRRHDEEDEEDAE